MRPHRLSLAVPVVVAFALAGCSAPASTTTTSTAASTPAASSAAPAPAVSSAAPAGSAIDKTAFVQRLLAGAKTVKTSQTDVELSVNTGGTKMAGEIDATADFSDASRTKMHMKMDLGPAELESVIDGSDYYIKMGGTWFKANKTAVEQAGGAAPLNPVTQLEALEPQIQKVEVLGEETVDGQALTFYRVTLDGAALGDLSGGAAGSKATAPKTVDYDVALDAKDIARAFRMNVKSDALTMSMSGTISDINEPVTISIPQNAQKLPGS